MLGCWCRRETEERQKEELVRQPDAAFKEEMPPCLTPSLTRSARGLGLNFIRWEISVHSPEEECLFQAAPPFIC